MVDPKVKVIFDFVTQGTEDVEAAQAQIKGMGTQVNDTQGAVRNMAMAMQQMGNMVNQVGNDSITAFASFDQAMANTISITQGTQEELDQLREMAERMGNEMPISSMAAAQGMYTLASAGKSASTQLAITEDIMKLSVATAADFSTTAGLVTAVLDAWNLENSDVQATTDMLMNTVKGFKTTLPELADSMKYAATTAATLGVRANTVAASIGQLRQQGLDASSAGTGLRMVFMKMAASANATEGALLDVQRSLVRNTDGTLDFQRTLENLQSLLSNTGPIERQAFLTEAFGARGATAAAILLNQSDNLNALANSLEQAGSVTSAYEVQEAGAMNQIQIMNSKMEEQQRIMGEVLLPAQLKMIEAKTKLLELVNKLPGGLGGTAIAFGMVAGEIGNALMPIVMLRLALKGLNLDLVKSLGLWIKKAGAVAVDTGASAVNGTVMGINNLVMKVMTAQLWSNFTAWLARTKATVADTVASTVNSVKTATLATVTGTATAAKLLFTTATWASVGAVLKDAGAKAMSTVATTANTVAHWAMTTATTAAEVAMWGLDAAMAANPIGLIIIATIALAAYLVAVSFAVEELTGGMIKWYEWLLYILGPVGWIILAIIHWKDILGLLGTAFSAVINMMVGNVVFLWGLVTGFVDFMVTVPERIHGAFTSILGDIKSQMIELGSMILTYLPDQVKGMVVSMVNAVLGFGKDLYQAGKTFISKFIDGVKDHLIEALGPVGKSLEKLGGLFGGSPPEWGPLKEAMDRGPAGFVRGYTENMGREISSYVNYTSSRTNVGPITFQNNLQPGMNVGEITRTQVVEIMRIANMEASR